VEVDWLRRRDAFDVGSAKSGYIEIGGNEKQGAPRLRQQISAGYVFRRARQGLVYVRLGAPLAASALTVF
jgi:hypothetical protein